MSDISKLQSVIDNTDNIVFFGGAGVSTESGIPDFRSVDGLYNQKYDYPPEEILSHTFFMNKCEEFYRYYKDKMLELDIQPNAAHKKLAELERAGKLRAVVTQNIDGLHQKAGSKVVYELHGTVHKNHCMTCGKFFDAAYVKSSQGVPRCDKCGGTIKPDVVLYEEGLDDRTVRGAVNAIAKAEVLIFAGTSLTVYPAAGLIHYFNGSTLVLINRDPTPFDNHADLIFHDKVGEILSQIKV
ncbi:MAG: NAD-dependent protein deacylase [Ruminococcus sp.]|nr:NAD-dependent protein deacylase [Ruminococcus sp.]